jgi:hypothetical protein
VSLARTLSICDRRVVICECGVLEIAGDGSGPFLNHKFFPGGTREMSIVEVRSVIALTLGDTHSCRGITLFI